jgi:membrane protease YdiL (CAAX protease family)
METVPSSSTPRNWLAAGVALGLPTLVTLVYFQWLRGADAWVQQSAYGIGKAIQFTFPVIFVWLFYREKFVFRKRTVLPVDSSGRLNNFHYGLVFGVAVVVLMFSMYFLLIDRTDISLRLKSMVTEKITSIGMDSVWKYTAMGVFYAICHSFLEEYYWRWFVFDHLRMMTSALLANLISSLGFMAHHVVLLGFFFGFWSPLTYLFSAAVGIGGVFWAWLYAREDGLFSPWISHMIVDSGIFLLGYFLVRETAFQV